MAAMVKVCLPFYGPLFEYIQLHEIAMNYIDQWYIEKQRINSNQVGRDYMRTSTEINHTFMLGAEGFSLE